MQPEIEKTSAVLSVSPLDADHLSLEAIIGDSSVTLLKARDLVSARLLLQQHDIATVVCERDLLPGTYIDLLEQIKAMPNPPSLIVASRLADERLWAEALNLGAWDVLATPFNPTEVLRSVKSGWQHWHHRDELQTDRTQQRMAATGT
jgi:DNA-binding NtrC family response regulator